MEESYPKLLLCLHHLIAQALISAKVQLIASFLQHFVSSPSAEMMEALLLNFFTGDKKDANQLAECEMKNFAKVGLETKWENESNSHCQVKFGAKTIAVSSQLFSQYFLFTECLLVYLKLQNMCVHMLVTQ